MYTKTDIVIEKNNTLAMLLWFYFGSFHFIEPKLGL